MAKVKLNIDRSYFNEKYIPYINKTARYNIFYGGAGSGKSYFLATKLIIQLMKEKHKLLVVRQTFASIRDSVYAELVSALDRMQLLPFVKISKTSLNITFPNGSQIIFKGGDSESKLLSISGITMCWIEEASELSKDLFQQLELRLRGGDSKKHFFLSFNPIQANHWLKAEFFDNPREDCIICHSTYLDNKHLDDEYIQSLLDMKERNPVKYEIYALGNWGVMGKRIYDNWKVKDFKLHELVQDNYNLKTAIGMDFGFINDPSTLICSLVDLENRKLYIFDEMYEKGLLNNQLADKIIEKGYAKQLIIADSAEQKSIAEIKQYGVTRIQPARKGAGSIMSGIQFLQQFDIYVHPSCKNTINELEQYAFKKDKATGHYINTPVDDYNHILDALRYSLESYMKQAKMMTINKAMFGF
ncbi:MULTISPECIES: PBSX family phage terminase large subunit [Gammaproteobacteria]|uniref:PBSX family phage terminase large subunit n=1 Tax=Acinetobacter sp. HRXRD-152 TaxID=3404808 RepID=UPI003BB5943F